MLRRLAVLLGFLCSAVAAGAQSPPGTATLILPEPPPRIAPRPLASALHAMREGRWDVARELAARDGPAASQMIDWYWLLAGFGTLREIMDFTNAHPDWPARDYLRKQAETKVDEADQTDILEFFRFEPPQTGAGVLAHAAALSTIGQQGDAEASLVLAWRSFDLSTEEHNAFLAAHEPLLKPHHEARLDMAWWRGLKDVELMLPLVSETRRNLIAARQLAKSGGSGLNEAIEALPEALRTDAGIAYGQFNRFVKSDADAAIALLLKQSRLENGLGQPEKWASWRRALARAQMREGNPAVAYELAALHQLVEGSSYSDLEWLSGYLALTYLKEPELALDHFQRFRAAVGSPISLGRAGYWIGRAQEALGDAEAAQLAYAEGAKHQTSFYGLLAAERAGLPVDPELSGQERFSSIKEGPLAQSSAVEAMVLSFAMGDRNKAERFVRHMADTLPRAQLGQLAALLEELGAAHLLVMLGKGAAQRGIVLHGAYYPLHPLTEMTLPVPEELALAIARRESEFDPDVVSGAGAQGLMQVMPGTARDVARDLGLEHDPSRVLSDWTYNATLGAEYLAQMAEQFDGNIVMISAAYNAGPARPPRWMETFGDPRGSRADDTNIVDWIEHIPFRETRNYVMRVSESLPVYRARLGKDPLPQPFSAELTGRSIEPRPLAPGE
ncbi:lytic transglycosylase domain-containing protein [Roseovarius faecimaris]|uniref:Lytic transglycosylase domain-containing protein n=1 Tax=Roseovarius faecimaris TaxID=2494550 RepID=A0A6I6IU84_9RHOB|nr:lytic transglycosylase domain-containing protein [Roseovarius faecimaris]QGX99654.1 lytic transglycosylase domain-containing protein [Roseovarius faecimaris]